MFVVMAASGYYVYTVGLSGGPSVEVPALIDLDVSEAARRLAQVELEMKLVSEPHGSVPRQHVITQRPEPGDVVRARRTVTVTVSDGPGAEPVPNFINRTLSEVETQLTELDISLAGVARIPSEAPRDTVLGQDPSPNEPIRSQGELYLLVSEGRRVQGTFMPDFRELELAKAEDLARSYELEPQITLSDVAGDKEGVVLDQFPPPDAIVVPGQQVTFTVKMPEYVGPFKHKFDYDWYDKSVRIAIYDRLGNKTDEQVYPVDFSAAAIQERVAGRQIAAKIDYAQSSTVRVYVDDVLVQTYLFEDGNPPIALGG